MYAASDMSRGMARHSLTLGLARLNREPRLRGGYALQRKLFIAP